MRRFIYVIFLACLSGIAFGQEGKITAKADRVRISPRNPRYFEYKQKPVFLTGARELEMLPRVGNYPYKQAVDRLAEAGCNHWRIEMYLSDSDREGKRKYPIVSTYKSWWHDPVTGKQEQLDAYKKNADGKFDLNLFNEPFWDRFQDFCELCADKGIVLTMEIWSTYTIWATSPFNPKNNINYSGPLDVGKHGRDADSEFSFVRTVPALGNRPEILKFQKKFAEKVLDCTWQAGNVLYICGNENFWPREWVEYWANFVHTYGRSKGVDLLYTNIPGHSFSPDRKYYMLSPGAEDVLTRPQYDFADMSQHPGGSSPPCRVTRYQRIVDSYKRSKNTPRPITILKNYIGTNETDVGKKRREAIEYFMAGGAMSGFHRPWAGGCPEERWNNCAEKMRKIYLSSLKAAGQVATFTSGVEFVDTLPRNDLVSRGWCLAKPGKHYIVYLKKGGESVDVKLEAGSYIYKVFDGQSWTKEEKFDWTGGQRTFKKAGEEDWGVYIEAVVEMSNDFLEFRCKSDGSQVTVRDKKRGVIWRLDERTRCYRDKPKEKVKLLGSGKAVVLRPGAIRQDFNIAGEKVSFLWEMLEDGLKVSLSFEKGGEGLYSVSLPGSFIPDDQSLTLALPISQGVLFDGRGKPFEARLNYGGNVAFSMAMMGYQTKRAAMLVSIDNETDWRAMAGKRDDGTIYSYSEQIASLGAMRYSRSAHLFPTDTGITALCKRYRSRVQERGKFKSWKEKIAERPAVERLFGSIVIFIGYQQGDFDYVAECKKLKRRGFDRALIFPVRFNVYSTDFKMGGDPPLYLSDEEILAIKQIGYDVSGLSWLTDALDDGAERIKHAFSRNSAGNRIRGWTIDEYRFYRVCTAFQTELMKEAYTGILKEMTWNMFDVTTNIGPVECYALDHPWHRGHALDRRGDLRFIKDLIGIETNGNRIIGSEGFADYVADLYDIAQAKLGPSYGKALFWTVPMTMLVYHDSIIHDYWVLQSYNYNSGHKYGSRFGRRETGHPKDKAAMDALYGCPPNVFPFGQQYRYIAGRGRKTESYTVRFEDAAVQEALTIALPVSKLHRRIGKLEMLSHEILSEDGAVQATTFSDGTRVIANFSEESRIVKDIGKIEAKSWKVIY